MLRRGKPKFYNLNRILEANAQYNIIFGERSNGKTFSVLEYGIKNYFEHGEQLAIVRRWRDDFTGKRGATMFDAVVSEGLITKYSNGEWDGVSYYAGRWFLCKRDPEKDKVIKSEEPFAFGFAITAMEHDKSTSYPRIRTIMFDEFITRGGYLPDEFVLFCNVISTIVRHRNDVKIFMLGNTVNQYCPYFNEMGLTNVRKMEPGKLDIYTYGQSELRVAVEYTDSPNKGKGSDIYFAFNNPKLNMIKGGAWEIDIYPHCPCKYRPKDILFTYFIQFVEDLLQCEIVQHENLLFTFIHRKTTPLKDTDKDLIYTPEYNPKPNYRRKITTPTRELERKIYWFYQNDKVFYQDNQIGEVIRNYLMWCQSN